MITAKFSRKSKDIEEALKKLIKSSGAGVDVGHFKESGMHYSGMTFPELMQLHHTGSFENNIPARPVLSILFENEYKLAEKPPIKKLIMEYMESDLSDASLEKMLSGIGKYLSAKEKRIFGSSLLAENAKSTQEMKGGRNSPLIDTGSLVDEVAYRTSVTNKITK